MSRTRPQTPDERALDVLVGVLPSGVEVRAESTAASIATVGGRELVIAWAGSGSLGDVRKITTQRGHLDVVVARHLSPGAREHLSAAGVGWADETGAAEIAVGSIIVSRTGRPASKPRKPPNWTPAVLAVSEALLCGTRATVSETTRATGLSTGSCTMALRVLTELGLLEANAARGRGSARNLADRRGLLDAYASAAPAFRPSLHLQVGVVWRDPLHALVEIGAGWDRAGVAWAATGVAAAAVLAPHLGSVHAAEVYVDANTIVGLQSAAEAVGLQPIDGGRLTLRPFPTVTADRLASTSDGLRVAPWPRVYVDLLGTGVRGEEAAEHLWEIFDARP